MGASEETVQLDKRTVCYTHTKAMYMKDVITYTQAKDLLNKYYPNPYQLVDYWTILRSNNKEIAQ